MNEDDSASLEQLQIVQKFAIRRMKSQPPDMLKDILKFKNQLSFSSEDDKLVFIRELRSELRKRHILSTKQIPSCMSLRKAGNPATKANFAELMELGIPLKRFTQTRDGKEDPSIPEALGDWIEINPNTGKTPSWSENRSWEEDQPESTQGEDIEAEVLPYEPKVYRNYRLSEYENIFDLIRKAALLHELTGESYDTILVLQSDLCRIDELLPAWLAGPHFRGKKRFSFTRLSQEECLTFFLAYHTHWGFFLHEMMRNQDHRKLRDWSRRLWFRVLALLKGEGDPFWNDQERKVFWTHRRKPSPERRKHRFLELLKTIDGMFIQRWLAFPSEQWNWRKYDSFVVTAMSDLIGDEFLDGIYTEESLQADTAFEHLKKIRGALKLGLLSEKEVVKSKMTFWSFLYFYDLARETSLVKSRIKRTMIIGLLIQKRGSGQPPAIVSSKAKYKFLKLISTPHEPLSRVNRNIVRYCVDKVIQSIPDEAFTGLVTKATLRVTTAACWEENQQDGGTLAALHNVMAGVDAESQVPIRDLETGKIVQFKKFSDCTIGEYMFWACLHYIIRHPLQESTRVKVVKVEEPGKTRIATKGSAYAKVVLDVINKICSYPLTKVDSSKSGMSMGNHGWRFFRSTFEGELKEFFFCEEKITTEKGTDGDIRNITYRKPFISSTDYETATDNFDLEIAKIISTAWLQRCGIPSVLRGVYNSLMYTERRIYFTGEGVFSEIGLVDTKEECFYVPLKRGLLMGDPLTKVQLHILNMSVRAFAHIQDEHPDILGRYFTNPSEIPSIIRGQADG